MHQDQADRFVQAMAEAIAFQRDFYKQVAKRKPQPMSQRLRNPGLLTYFKNMSTGELYPLEGGAVEFPSTEVGWQALKTVVRLNALDRKLSLREFFRGRRTVYAGFASRSVENADELMKVVASRLASRHGIQLNFDVPIHEQLRRSS